jgi:hypothetical protein
VIDRSGKSKSSREAAERNQRQELQKTERDADTGQGKQITGPNLQRNHGKATQRTKEKIFSGYKMKAGYAQGSPHKKHSDLTTSKKENEQHKNDS